MQKKNGVLALVAHPDDIEFMMAGTLLMLKQKGWEIHYLTIANGSCGSAVDDAATIVAKRQAECRAACALVGAHWQPPICNDLEILYDWDIIRRVVGVIRQIKPRIVLTQSPDDYMEDHINTCRIAVTAAFCRGMLNAQCEPPTPPFQDDLTIYHAMPHGLLDPFRRRIEPEFFVNISPVMQQKWDMLSCHKSQKEWLDISQGMDAYQQVMKAFATDLGERSGKFNYAEGWRRRSWLGFSAADSDPLADALGGDVIRNPVYSFCT